MRLRTLVLALLHGFDEGGGRGDAGVDFYGREVKREVDFLREIGAFVLVAATENGRGGGGGVGARGRGFAPGETKFDFDLIFSAVEDGLVEF